MLFLSTVNVGFVYYFCETFRVWNLSRSGVRESKNVTHFCLHVFCKSGWEAIFIPPSSKSFSYFNLKNASNRRPAMHWYHLLRKCYTPFCVLTFLLRPVRIELSLSRKWRGVKNRNVTKWKRNIRSFHSRRWFFFPSRNDCENRRKKGEKKRMHLYRESLSGSNCELHDSFWFSSLSSFLSLDFNGNLFFLQFSRWIIESTNFSTNTKIDSIRWRRNLLVLFFCFLKTFLWFKLRTY